MTRQSWEDRAACKDHPTPAIFFPERKRLGKGGRGGFTYSNAERSEEALALCQTCPVQEPCRALGRELGIGIWGGVFHG